MLQNTTLKADLKCIVNAYKLAKQLGALFQCPFCGRHIPAEELHFEDALCEVLANRVRNSIT